MLLLLLAAEAAVPAALCPCAVRRPLHHVLWGLEGPRPTWVHHHGGHWVVALLLVVVGRAVAAATATASPSCCSLRCPNAWWGPLHLHHPSSTAAGCSRLWRLLPCSSLSTLPPTVLLLVVHHWRAAAPNLVVRHHVRGVGVCPHGWWGCPCVLHMPRGRVGLHHGWWSPHSHVGAVATVSSVCVAGRALVAVRGRGLTLTLLAMVAATGGVPVRPQHSTAWQGCWKKIGGSHT